MDEYLLEIRYLVDDLGDVVIDDGLVRIDRMPGFEYKLIIKLPGAHPKTKESSKLFINDSKHKQMKSVSCLIKNQKSYYS